MHFARDIFAMQKRYVPSEHKGACDASDNFLSLIRGRQEKLLKIFRNIQVSPRSVTHPNMSICEERTHKGSRGVPWSRDQTAWISLGILLLLCKHKEVVEDAPRLARGGKDFDLIKILLYKLNDFVMD